MFSCAQCESSFTRKDNLKRHIDNHGSIKEKSRKCASRILCCLCDKNFTSFGPYHDHLKNNHHKELARETVKFRNIEEFKEWKTNLEKETTSTFVQTSSAKKSKNNVSVYYFYCHRSFLGKKNKKEIKNHVKHAGSNKIDKSCPAMIKVRVTNESVDVQFCSTHLGHECEIDRLRLSKEDKNFLAEKLSAGISPRQILIDLKQEAPNELHRIHYVNRNDLHNIRRSYGITCSLRYDNSWIREEEISDDANPVFFYENQCSDSELLDENFQEEIFLPIDVQNEVTIQFEEKRTTNESDNCKRNILMAKLASASDTVEKALSRLNDEQMDRIIDHLNSISSVVNELHS